MTRPAHPAARVEEAPSLEPTAVPVGQEFMRHSLKPSLRLEWGWAKFHGVHADVVLEA